MSKRSKARARKAEKQGVSAVVERFAPSPNGALHLGHAYSALLASDAATAAGGVFLLRHEDLDQTRARAEHVANVEVDLRWLGLAWPEPCLFQSARSAAYGEALASLEARGLLYPCYCTRADIAAALSAPQEGAPIHGPDGIVYPGVCRDRPRDGAPAGSATSPALRLDMRRAIAALGGRGVVDKLSFKEIGAGPGGETGRINLEAQALIHGVGDVALARRDAAASYHLAVVLDDAHQGVTHVTRGEDLFAATPLHRLLQALLGRPTPIYRHHRLIRDAAGRRLAKRDRDAGLSELRAEGVTPEEIREKVGLPPARRGPDARQV